MLGHWVVLEEVGKEGTELPGGQPAQPQEGEPPVDDRWSEFLVEDTEVDEGEPEGEPPVEPAPVTETPPTEPAPAEPLPAVQEPVTAPVTPAQPLSSEQLAEYKDRFRVTLEDHYKISEEDALALQTEPEKVLPQMAARLHMEVLDAVMQHVYGALPNVIESYTQNTVREQKAQEEFFGAWPELKGSESQVLQMGQMFRQLNPSATPQEAIQRIGEMTLAALGKQRAVKQEAQAPAAPAKPFQPAAPGRMSTPVPVHNKWEAVMDDDD